MEIKIRLWIPAIMLAISSLFLVTNCTKDDDVTAETTIPVLTTNEVLEITQTTATSGGNVTSDGGAAITARGVCWGTSQNPTISDSKTEDGTGTGSFTSSITNLEFNTKYYVRAYATNSEGTSYGNELSFTTLIPADPVLTTNEVLEITQTTATSGGNVTSDGGAAITARGVCWGTSQNPTISDNKTEDGTGTGSFTSSITDLEPNTTYYLRAYATNSAGTGYGSAMSFTTIEETTNGTFTDTRDGNEYNWVKIGNQVWMAENLAYLPSVNKVADGYDDVAGSYYYVYGYDGTDVTAAKATSNYTTYGVLYNWTAAMAGSRSSRANPSGVQGVCPSGWHLPSVDEWNELEMALGMSQEDADDSGWRGTNEGSKLAGNAGLWSDGALESDADFGTSGFTALPGGYRSIYGYFRYIGEEGCWWSATVYSGDVQKWELDHGTSTVFTYNASKEAGYSVRCVRD